MAVGLFFIGEESRKARRKTIRTSLDIYDNTVDELIRPDGHRYPENDKLFEVKTKLIKRKSKCHKYLEFGDI